MYLLVPYLAGLALCAASEDGARHVPLYTNVDLERVSPLRGQTGVLSQPASVTDVSSSPRPKDSSRARRERDEAFWRRESARLRSRIEPLARRARALERRIAAQAAVSSRDSRSRARDSARIRRLEEQRLELLERIKSMQADLEERARRARALPGWLR
jgi:predicted RNase H-like nuclease (RuvC/YqgF family)